MSKQRTYEICISYDAESKEYVFGCSHAVVDASEKEKRLPRSGCLRAITRCIAYHKVSGWSRNFCAKFCGGEEKWARVSPGAKRGRTKARPYNEKVAA